MGRELRRKQAKKEGKSLQRELSNEKNQIKSLVIITIVLLIVMGLIYLLSALFITKELDWFNKNDQEETVEVVKNTILALETFKQKEEEYYVYFYDYNFEYEQIASTVNEKLSSKQVYKVNTNDALNTKYVSETSNKKATKLEDLKVKSPTVVKITKGKLTAYYEGNEILEKLK